MSTNIYSRNGQIFNSDGRQRADHQTTKNSSWFKPFYVDDEDDDDDARRLHNQTVHPAISPPELEPGEIAQTTGVQTLRGEEETATTVAVTEQPTPPAVAQPLKSLLVKPKSGLAAGRPTKAVSLMLAAQRELDYEERRREVPAERKSTRQVAKRSAN